MIRAAAPLVAAALALAACSHEGRNLSGRDHVDPPHAGEPSPPAPRENAPDPHAALDPHAGMTPPPAPAAAEGPVAWTVPDGWTGGASKRPMRVAEFDVGDGVQCVVYGGIGGDDEQNLDRWIGQMGDAAKAGAKTTHADHDGLSVTRLEVHGGYTDAMGPGEPKTIDEATMLAAIVNGPAGKLHVKMVGPSKTVDANAAKFDAFLASMRAK